MRLVSSNFPELRLPFLQGGIVQEFRESFIADRLNFWPDEGRRFAYFRKQILQLSHAREVLRIRTVLRELERSEVVNALDFLIERFVELEASREGRGRFAETTFPFEELRIAALNPGKILRPFAGIGEEMGQVPLVGIGNLGASRSQSFRSYQSGCYTAAFSALQRVQSSFSAVGVRMRYNIFLPRHLRRASFAWPARRRRPHTSCSPRSRLGAKEVGIF